MHYLRSVTIVLRIFLFGATGDLSIKKLYPALYALHISGNLPEDHEIICIGRRPYDQSGFQAFIIEEVGGVRDVKQWYSFIKRLRYVPVVFESLEDYEKLYASVEDHKSSDVHIFYLATAPQYFEVIAAHIHGAGLLEYGNLNHRLVIEKPFGKDLSSATQVNSKLSHYVVEPQIYRMDHYLGKEMIQNILMLRFDNTIFESSWHKDAIDHIQITVSESGGVEERAGYYDRSGAVRDMIQSHLLQMLALVAMDPACLDQDAICSAKTDVFKQLSIENVERDVVLGQYRAAGPIKGYLEEEGVPANSGTETFAAMKLRVDAPKWQGVDFYLRTGKRLKAKVSEIVVVYKAPQQPSEGLVPPNRLTIQIHPQEGMKLMFNMKQPGHQKALITREMSFCQSCLIDYDAQEAYETLIMEVIGGKHELYTRWDEVEAAWQFVSQILGACRQKALPLHAYAAGSHGPEAAQDLITRDKRAWID